MINDFKKISTISSNLLSITGKRNTSTLSKNDISQLKIGLTTINCISS